MTSEHWHPRVYCIPSRKILNGPIVRRTFFRTCILYNMTPTNMAVLVERGGEGKEVKALVGRTVLAGPCRKLRVRLMS